MNSPNISSDQPLGDRTHEKTVRDSEQLERIAHLVAAGELPVPTDLAADQTEQLVAMVRERRRRRLVQFLARAIATSIRSESEQAHERPENVKEPV
jgi:hypothetical protein